MGTKAINTVAIATWNIIGGRVRQARAQGPDRGLTTTEVAVLTFVLVAIAVAIGAMLYTYASDTVSEAPTPDLPNFNDG